MCSMYSYLCETHSELGAMFEMYDEELRGFVSVVSYILKFSVCMWLTTCLQQLVYFTEFNFV